MKSELPLLFTVDKVATYLGTDEEFVKSLIKEQKLGAIRFGDKDYRVTSEQILEFIKVSTVKPTPKLSTRSRETKEGEGIKIRDIVEIIKEHLPKNEPIEVQKIHAEIEKYAAKAMLLTAKDLVPNPSHNRPGSTYSRLRHVSQAALQELKKSKSQEKYSLRAIHHKANRSYTFIGDNYKKEGSSKND